MIFNIKQTEDGITKDLIDLKTRVVSMLWDLVSDLTDVAEDTAHDTIFNSSVKGFKRKTGDFQSEGLNRVTRSQKARGFSVSSFLSSRAGNLFENFKNRKRVYLYRNLKREFSKNSKVDTLISKAIEDLSR